MENTRDDRDTSQDKAASLEKTAATTTPKKRSWWQRLWYPAELEEPDMEQLPAGTPLPDILTKMLVESGCTVNKDGMVKLADFFIEALTQALDTQESYIRKTRHEIEDEHDLYHKK